MKLIYSLIIATSFISLGSGAYADDAEFCKIQHATLVCGNSLKDGDIILEAMANPKSMAILAAAGKDGLIYKGGNEREAFRKSIEANRVAMKKFADSAWKQYKRRKMKAASYEIIRTKYNTGMKTYQAAIDLYRAGTWKSKTKGIQAD